MVENGQNGVSSVDEQTAKELASLTATLTATPTSAVPFGSVTLRYDVTKPSSFTFPLTLKLAGTTLTALTGTVEATITGITNEVFALVASTSLASRSLATVTVDVDAAACKSGTIPWVIITGEIASSITTLLAQGGLVSSQGPTVTQSGGVISIDVTVPGPSSSTLEAKITLSFEVSGSSVAAIAGTVTVHVVASTASDIFGDTSTAEAVAQPFVQILVNALLIPGVETAINNQITTTASGYQLAAINTTDPDNFIFTVCPVGPSGLHLANLSGLQVTATERLA